MSGMWRSNLLPQWTLPALSTRQATAEQEVSLGRTVAIGRQSAGSPLACGKVQLVLRSGAACRAAPGPPHARLFILSLVVARRSLSRSMLRELRWGKERLSKRSRLLGSCVDHQRCRAQPTGIKAIMPGDRRLGAGQRVFLAPRLPGVVNDVGMPSAFRRSEMMAM